MTEYNDEYFDARLAELAKAHRDIWANPSVIFEEGAELTSERVLLGLIYISTNAVGTPSVERVIHHLNEDDAIFLFYYERNQILGTPNVLWMWLVHDDRLTTERFWATIARDISFSETTNASNISARTARMVMLDDEFDVFGAPNYNYIRRGISGSWKNSDAASRALMFLFDANNYGSGNPTGGGPEVIPAAIWFDL